MAAIAHPTPRFVTASKFNPAGRANFPAIHNATRNAMATSTP
jgi:hypothetical protein